jgi:DNA-binding CsgD family transcriptional regulator
LTRRQGQILALVVEGRSNRAIAALLGVGERTVEAHLTAIYERAQVEGRSQLVARLWGL